MFVILGYNPRLFAIVNVSPLSYDLYSPLYPDANNIEPSDVYFANVITGFLVISPTPLISTVDHEDPEFVEI